jgi:hypothetical protein
LGLFISVVSVPGSRVSMLLRETRMEADLNVIEHTNHISSRCPHKVNHSSLSHMDPYSLPEHLAFVA